jgi:2-polyprenyl-3-methyl-5-hydroxy-6-metoxy-1,4-benzoquinol methylase
MDPVNGREERWSSEARFFDGQAARVAEVKPMDATTLERYASARHVWFNKEFRFRLVGDLRGKRVLDVGCGNGDNAILLASRGANVVAIDLSPESVALAARRAEASGFHSRIRFVCSPLETAELESRGFDVIWGDGILHHVIPELDQLLARLRGFAKPGALYVFSEPVSYSPTLRRLRSHVPIRTDATPGERPLEPAELELIRRHLPGFRVRHFGLVARFNRLVLPSNDLEHAGRIQKAIVHLNCCVDQALLAIPGLERVANTAVIYGHIAA